MKSEGTAKRWGWHAAVRAALVLFWLVAFAATHTPVDKLPHTGVSNDKLKHFVGYGLLGFLLCAALATFRPWHWRLVLIAIAIAALYGVFDELTQLLVGRSAEFNDWLADLAGAACGSLAAGGMISVARWLRDRESRNIV